MGRCCALRIWAERHRLCVFRALYQKQVLPNRVPLGGCLAVHEHSHRSGSPLVHPPRLCSQEPTFAVWVVLVPALLAPALFAVVVDTLGCFLAAEGALLLPASACDATYTTAELLCTPQAEWAPAALLNTLVLLALLWYMHDCSCILTHHAEQYKCLSVMQSCCHAANTRSIDMHVSCLGFAWGRLGFRF